MDWAKTIARWDGKHLTFGIWCILLEVSQYYKYMKSNLITTWFIGSGDTCSLTRLYTYGWVEWFAGFHEVPHAVPVCASYGPRKGIFNVFPIPRDPCGTRKGAVRHLYGHVRELIQPELTKIPHGCRIWPYGAHTGPLLSPHGLFMGYLGYQNPYGALKLILHALKIYGPRTGRQNLYGAARAPWMDVRFLFKTGRE